jgi:cytochrome c biogenesis protein CcmG/thiol:disulfide interchange protein DsbE
VLALVVVLVVGGLTAWVIASADDPSNAARRAHCPAMVTGSGGLPEQVAPDFTLPALDGRCVTLSALRGRPVVVNFWASWCNPCREEFPLLRDALRARDRSGLEIVGVTYRDIEDDARRFAEERGADWTLLVDDDGAVAAAYGVNRIPQTLFVRRDGTVLSRFYGPLSRAELRAELDRLERS